MINGADAYHGDIAENYERDRIKEAIWSIEQKYFEEFLKSLSLGCSLLDLPIGTGRFINYYKKYQINFIGCDISNEMLAIAKNNYQIPTDRLIQSAAEKLPFKDNQFEYAICCRLTHLLSHESLKMMVKELARVVSKRMVIHFFTLTAREKTNIIKRIFNRVKKIINPIKEPIEIPKKTSWSDIQNYLHDKDDVEKMFFENNLKIIRLDHLPDEKYKVDIYVLEKI